MREPHGRDRNESRRGRRPPGSAHGEAVSIQLLVAKSLKVGRRGRVGNVGYPGCLDLVHHLKRSEDVREGECVSQVGCQPDARRGSRGLRSAADRRTRVTRDRLRRGRLREPQDQQQRQRGHPNRNAHSYPLLSKQVLLSVIDRFEERENSVSPPCVKSDFLESIQVTLSPRARPVTFAAIDSDTSPNRQRGKSLAGAAGWWDRSSHGQGGVVVMKCLVTGAAGFIGSHLCEELLRRGHSVVGLDAFIPYYPRVFKDANLAGLLVEPRFRFHEIDLRRDDLTAVCKDVEAVFHLAAMPGLPRSWSDFDLYQGCNLAATHRLLEVARHMPLLRRFLYGSTSSVYGRYASGDETMPVRPISPYGVTKLAAENLCRAHSEECGLPLVVLRFFSVFGPRQRPDMGYHRFIEAMLQGQPVIVNGDGLQVRGNTYISDCVAATLAALEAPVGELYNVGGGETANVWEILSRLEAILGTRALVRREPARIPAISASLELIPGSCYAICAGNRASGWMRDSHDRWNGSDRCYGQRREESKVTNPSPSGRPGPTGFSQRR